MEMKLANRESKSILAKLLASENLTVEHGKFNTASFDVKNRVLRLPIWKEMSGNLYDLLVLHEVGHALFTPEEGLHDASGYGKGFKSYLNVVEDARIERKIKIKYPGGRRSFIKGYSDLMERDFFGLKKEKTYNLESEKLNLIDKINLHYKVGDHMNLTFSDEENVFIDRIDKANTWKEVVKICEDLYEYAKENESETDMSDHDWEEFMTEDDEEDSDWDDNYDPSDYEDSDGISDDSKENRGEGEEENDKGSSSSENSDEENNEEGKGGSEEGDEEAEKTEGGTSSGAEGGTDGDYEPESKTDRNFRNNEHELVSEEAKPYVYINLPNKVDLKNIIVNYSDLYEGYKKIYSGENQGRYDHRTGSEMMTLATEKFNDFRSKNKKVVEYLAKEFEMKKAAKEHSRAATANSGILDSERLYTYKYNEHIFKKLTITPDGKNQGLVMFVDWSGSMGRNIKGTIEQMMVLVMFCKRVNIPFEVYAFSDSYTRYDDEQNKSWIDSNGYMTDPKIREYGTVALNRFNLMNLFSSRMKAKQLHDAYIYMTATAQYYSGNYSWSPDIRFDIPNEMHLGGTPLNSTLFISFSVMREFVKKNQVDVINSIFLTDGDSHSCNNYWVGENETKHFDPKSENVIFRDSVSKKEMRVNYHSFRTTNSITEALVRFQRDVFDINIVNFFLSSKMRKYDMADYLDRARRARGENDEGIGYEEIDAALRRYRKDKYMIAPEMMGFNEQYLIQGGRNLEVEETPLEVAEDATVAQMARAFKKFSSGKLQQRRLLSRFIDMVAK
jgi:cobalamin biosynthesis protein CobT